MSQSPLMGVLHTLKNEVQHMALLCEHAHSHGQYLAVSDLFAGITIHSNRQIEEDFLHLCWQDNWCIRRICMHHHAKTVHVCGQAYWLPRTAHQVQSMQSVEIILGTDKIIQCLSEYFRIQPSSQLVSLVTVNLELLAAYLID